MTGRDQEERPVEVKIGIQHAPRELLVDTVSTADQVLAQLGKALRDGGVLTLTDSRGRQVAVPASGIAYLEIGGGVSGHVGFRS